ACVPRTAAGPGRAGGRGRTSAARARRHRRCPVAAVAGSGGRETAGTAGGARVRAGRAPPGKGLESWRSVLEIPLGTAYRRGAAGAVTGPTIRNRRAQVKRVPGGPTGAPARLRSGISTCAPVRFRARLQPAAAAIRL